MAHHTHPHGRDPRLSFSLGSAAWRLATVDEHARSAGMAVDELLDHLEPHLESGEVAIEAHDGVLFLDTAAGGGSTGITPNLWSTMRRTLAPQVAAARWRAIRALEAGGWRVETRPEILERLFGHVRPGPWCAVEVKERPVPLVWEPTPAQLAAPRGVCDTYANVHEPLVAVTCPAGHLEEYVAAVRSWVLTRGAVAGGGWLSVLVLEAPTFTATLLRCTDNSVAPVAFARSDRGQ